MGGLYDNVGGYLNLSHGVSIQARGFFPAQQQAWLRVMES